MIEIIKSCKTKNITPTFAEMKMSLRYGTYKLKLHIVQLVMYTKMQKKQLEKKKLKKDQKHIGIQIKHSLG